jgi:hypothetical protein
MAPLKQKPPSQDPLSVLPNEIVAMIFSFCVPEDLEDVIPSIYSAPFQLTHVSHA